MNEVASFRDDGNGNGNKMSISNLATIMAPNIIYLKTISDSFQAADALTMIFEQGEDVFLVNLKIIIGS
jgi:hypothetical protein